MGKTKKHVRNNLLKNRKTVKNFSKKEHQVITEFKKMIETNPIERQYMTTMITSIPNKKRYSDHPKSLDDLFKKLNNVLTQAPGLI